MIFDPKILVKEKQSNQGNISARFLSIFIQQMKSTLEKVFDSKTLKVKLDNEESITSGISQITQALKTLSTTRRDTVGKAQFTVQSVSGFNVANLESLTLENIERLKISLEQLQPIIQLLQNSNSLNNVQIQTLNKIGNTVSSLIIPLNKIFTKEVRFPDVQKVSGLVDVRSIPFDPEMKRVTETINKLSDKLSLLKPKEVSNIESKKILVALNELKEAIQDIPKSMPEAVIPKSIMVSNFPPTKTAMPATHISINSLAGTVKSTAVTVTTALIPLPGEVLADRRGLVIYNNSSVTVEIGGSAMTFGNGVPVPAGTYSPSFDAGKDMIIYGRVSTGTADVRVLELSDISVGR